jgi:hypothetical protein
MTKQKSKKIGRPIEWTEKKAMEVGNSLIEWMQEEELNIFFDEFLINEKGLYPEFIYKMSKKYPEFRQVIKKAKSIQEIKIAKVGLSSKDMSISDTDSDGLTKRTINTRYSSSFAMFFLKCRFGWMEEEKKQKMTEDKMMNRHKIEMDTQTNQIRLQELEIKKEIAELNKKRNEDDLIHTITFDDSNPIINP